LDRPYRCLTGHACSRKLSVITEAASIVEMVGRFAVKWIVMSCGKTPR